MIPMFKILLSSGLLVALVGCRGGISEDPPVHLVLDMDFQPKIKSQSATDFEGWSDHRGMRRPVAGAVLTVAFDMLTLYLIFIAAGHPVSPGILLAGYGLPLLLGRLSILPGGVGIVEGTMTLLYDGLGVPNPITVVVILAYRAISFWLPALLGFLLIPYFQHTSQRAIG